MKITDKDRLDFLENNYIEIYRIDADQWEACDGFGVSGIGKTHRECIDNAIFAMKEKEK